MVGNNTESAEFEGTMKGGVSYVGINDNPIKQFYPNKLCIKHLGLLNCLLSTDEYQTQKEPPIIFGRSLLHLVGDGNSHLHLGDDGIELAQEFIVVGNLL